MNEKTLKILEFSKIKEMLKEEAVSFMAKDLAWELEPLKDIKEIKKLILETTEAANMIARKGSLPIGGLYNVKGYILTTQKGGSLSAKQLLEIMQCLYTARKIANFLKEEDEAKEDIISQLGMELRVLKKEEEEIDRCILSEEEIADAASTALRDIRRSILKHNEGLRSKMNSIIQSKENKDMLQDSLFTLRQGRYVIPVKLEHKNKFPGIVHDQSATGATLFIEPQAIVNLNNELRELHLKERAEIERILAQLSAMIGEVVQEIISNQDILVRLDFLFAKGKLSMQMKASAPELNENGFTKLREARHPLIDRKKVVPMSVEIGKNYHTLVITGPNTGGKTVTLKTMGLLQLMAQSGLHVPAQEGTQMCVYQRIFADIGDEQSIEQSLSTFSSHMTNIIRIVDEASVETLVLLDELGAGTDPTEGAALAISVLDDLRSKGARIVATTHYTELKKYALTANYVENASVEFDVETLSPTYRLSIGTPGKSNAFEISKKLGLPEYIIVNARSMIEKGDIEFEELLANIDQDKKRAEAERDEAILLKLQMKKMQEDLQKQKERFEASKEKALSKAKEDAREIVKEMKELSDEVFKELRELEHITDAKTRNKKYEEIRKRVKDASGKVIIEKEEIFNDAPIKANELKLGTTVKVLSLDQIGSVISLPDEKGELMVQVGLLKVNVKLSNLMQISENAKKKELKSKYGQMYRSKGANIRPSVDVRGMMPEEAEDTVDKYLDDAYMAGLKNVTVIHGRGEGVLRAGIRTLLKHHKHVESYRAGGFNEGGDGATIATLK